MYVYFEKLLIILGLRYPQENNIEECYQNHQSMDFDLNENMMENILDLELDLNLNLNLNLKPPSFLNDDDECFTIPKFTHYREYYKQILVDHGH